MHALAAVTAADADGVDLSNLHAKQLFDCLSNLNLGGVGSNLEGVLLIGNACHGVLGDDGGENDILCELHHAYTSSSFLAASRLTISLSAFTTS